VRAAGVFAHRDHLSGAAGEVGVGFTRPGFDLGDRAADDVRRVALDAVAAETGARPLVMHQVHGADVQVVEDWPASEWGPHVDALVTGRSGVALLARAADCVPVLLADPDVGLVGAVHAGRAGVALGVVPAALARMRELGAGEVTAWVGPHICGACYEVPRAMREEVAARVPETWAVSGWDTPALDLGAGVRAQLDRAGGVTLRRLDACTRELTEWPSHRRDGADAARFAGVVWRS